MRNGKFQRLLIVAIVPLLFGLLSIESLLNTSPLLHSLVLFLAICLSFVLGTAWIIVPPSNQTRSTRDLTNPAGRDPTFESAATSLESISLGQITWQVQSSPEKGKYN